MVSPVSTPANTERRKAIKAAKAATTAPNRPQSGARASAPDGLASNLATTPASKAVATKRTHSNTSDWLEIERDSGRRQARRVLDDQQVQPGQVDG